MGWARKVQWMSSTNSSRSAIQWLWGRGEVEVYSILKGSACQKRIDTTDQGMLQCFFLHVNFGLIDKVAKSRPAGGSLLGGYLCSSHIYTMNQSSPGAFFANNMMWHFGLECINVTTKKVMCCIKKKRFEHPIIGLHSDT